MVDMVVDLDRQEKVPFYGKIMLSLLIYFLVKYCWNNLWQFKLILSEIPYLSGEMAFCLFFFPFVCHLLFS